MGCRCAERRTVIATATTAIAAGDTQTAIEQVVKFGQTIRDDFRDLKTRIAQGRQSLIRRR